jgi:uncharacterized protein YdeI (BOF family)
LDLLGIPKRPTSKENVMIRAFLISVLALFIVAPVAAEKVTPIADLEPGMTATVEGKVTRILDEDEFRMEDETGSVRVYIGWKNRVSIPVGETISVRVTGVRQS